MLGGRREDGTRDSESGLGIGPSLLSCQLYTANTVQNTVPIFNCCTLDHGNASQLRRNPSSYLVRSTPYRLTSTGKTSKPLNE
jgi:hypothetical protein